MNLINICAQIPKMIVKAVSIFLVLGLLTLCRSESFAQTESGLAEARSFIDFSKFKNKFKKPDITEIKRKLTETQFKVTQEEGTETPFQNEYWDHHKKGIYVDIVTGEPLFSSKDKFESGTGWPSFSRTLSDAFIIEKKDISYGMSRTEVKSKIGGSHLGHVFDDGPKPKGLRYCMNSASLRFIAKEDLEKLGYGELLKEFSLDK